MTAPHASRPRPLLAGALLLLAACSDAPPEAPSADATAEEMLALRRTLDESVWAPEVEAATFEQTFVDLWDAIRAAEGDDKMLPLAAFPFASLTLPAPAREQPLELGITRVDFAADADTASAAPPLDPEAWQDLLARHRDLGWRIVQTEWHHHRFVPGTADQPPASDIRFSIHAIRPSTRTSGTLDGELHVRWTDPPTLAVTELRGLHRTGGGFFRRTLTIEGGEGEFATGHPVLLHDLDGDGLSEIILPRWNRAYRNLGSHQFEKTALVDHPVPLWESAILADVDGDTHTDLVAVAKDGFPVLYRGSADGRFPTPPTRCADFFCELPSAITAGDIDGDGDLDLWLTQYRLSFQGGQMPTPYYDANDGHPSALLRNDGAGSFTDITEAAGLAPLRHRRTYSAVLVDADEDGDLDLFNVSDYAGIDIHRNDGSGRFTLCTDDWIRNRGTFGMGQTFADYDHDGRLDFYVIGMSSTTARRLDSLGLGRDDRPDIHRMRSIMGFGNRLYFGTDGSGDTRFREIDAVVPAVARTGWSWGVTSADFDLDGDRDLYVANGHRSGASSRDYCSTFWRHDIYTGNSQADPEVRKVFQSVLSDLDDRRISWNGHEKNHLFLNHPGLPERFVNVAFLLGLGLAFDARVVVSDDLDADGRPDLVLTESWWDGRGFVTATHVFRNELEFADPASSSRHWIGLRLRPRGPGRSTHGAVVTVHTPRGPQRHWIVSGDSFASQHAPVAHFGLGDLDSVDALVVTWPDGSTERLDNPPVDRYATLPE